MFFLLLGCNPCDENALGAALTGDDVAAACKLPPPLAEWQSSGAQEPPAGVEWTCSAPAKDSPRIASRRAVHAACGVGDEHDFVFSGGQPYLAVAFSDWAKDNGVSPDKASVFVGQPVIPPVELPILEIDEPVPPTGEFSTLARDALIGELTEGPLRLAVQDGDDWLHLVEIEQGTADIKVRETREGLLLFEEGAWRYAGKTSQFDRRWAETVQVDLLPDTTIQDWLEFLDAQNNVVRGPVERCGDAPDPGMVCVPSDVHTGVDGVVLLPNFFIDTQPVTQKQYQACVDEGFCKPGDASALSYLRLEDYCTWSGKRPPNEQEWEAALAIGAIQPSGREWTMTYWYDEDPDHNSFQVDPWGPCGGGYPCSGNVSKVVRGPQATDRLRMSRSNQAAGGRCATRAATLATWPPQHLVQPPEHSWRLPPLQDDKLALVQGVVDDAIDEVPICTDRVGLSSLDCKDPVNHVVPNEERYHVVLPYITNRGGGYVGVASDQNYTFVVEAKSEYAWFMDYDAVIVHLHQVARAVFLKADSREEFVGYYAADGVDKMLALLDETYAGHPDLELYKSDYSYFRGKLHRHFVEQMQPDAVWGERGWLRTQANYEWIRNLWRAGRAKTVKGNMLGDNAMLGIAEAAEGLGTPIRVYYTSNAPSAWGSEMTPSYKRNVRALPMDEQSIVVQVFGFKTGFGQTGYWHYNIQSGLQQQEHLGRYDWLWQVYWPSLPSDDDDLTVSGLPGAAERKPVTRTYVVPTY